MKTRTICFFLPLLLLSASGYAQENQPSTFTIAVNQDNAFGFYPAVYGSFGLSETLSFTYYGLLWTNPAYGNPNLGTDAWTEMGVGFSFGAFNDKLLLNPSLGFTHGSLLSGGPKAVVGDGVVPSLVGFLLDERFEAEIFVAYYKSMRKEGPITNDYVLYWVYPGIVITSNLSLGFHYESFVLSRTDAGPTGARYTWTGGYLKFTVGDTYTFRISAGANVTDSSLYADEFYKLNVVIPILQ